MKKLLIFLTLVIVAMAGYSQIRTIQSDKVMKTNPLSSNSITWSYTGITADTLSVLQDTLIYNITLNKAAPYNYYIKVAFDTIAGIDTTVVLNVNGRMFDDESWTLIETTTTAAISAEINTVVESMTDSDYYITFGADSVSTITPSIKPCWRQIQLEMIISGNDAVGTGITLEDIEWYFQEAK